MIPESDPYLFSRNFWINLGSSHSSQNFRHVFSSHVGCNLQHAISRVWEGFLWDILTPILITKLPHRFFKFMKFTFTFLIIPKDNQSPLRSKPCSWLTHCNMILWILQIPNWRNSEPMKFQRHPRDTNHSPFRERYPQILRMKYRFHCQENNKDFHWYPTPQPDFWRLMKVFCWIW